MFVLQTKSKVFFFQSKKINGSIHKNRKWISWDHKNYIFAQKWLRWDLILATEKTIMGKGLWEASGTYPAKINPSTPPPPKRPFLSSKTLTFKTRLSRKPLLWKWIFLYEKKKTFSYQWIQTYPIQKCLIAKLGSCLGFKWQGWSNGDKNQNPKKSLGLPTKPQKFPGPNFNPKKIPCWISEPDQIYSLN